MCEAAFLVDPKDSSKKLGNSRKWVEALEAWKVEQLQAVKDSPKCVDPVKNCQDRGGNDLMNYALPNGNYGGPFEGVVTARGNTVLNNHPVPFSDAFKAALKGDKAVAKISNFIHGHVTRQMMPEVTKDGEWTIVLADTSCQGSRGSEFTHGDADGSNLASVLLKSFGHNSKIVVKGKLPKLYRVRDVKAPLEAPGSLAGKTYETDMSGPDKDLLGLQVDGWTRRAVLTPRANPPCYVLSQGTPFKPSTFLVEFKNSCDPEGTSIPPTAAAAAPPPQFKGLRANNAASKNHR